jgi:hypothetical protein
MVAQMQKLNEQFEAFIKLQNQAREDAAKASEEAEKALKKETATMKALNITYNKKGKLVRDGKLLVNEFGQEVNRVGEVVSNFNKRTTVLTKAIEDLNSQGKSFEIFSRDARKAYMEAGGNIFEFIAEGISGTREEITIFGQEGAKIRKIMYGFFPPGTFRALNKTASILQAVGSATRRASRSTEDYQKDIDALKEKQKGLSEESEDYINLQETINKMREDMKQGGGNIIGTAVKALGKIPRVGKFKEGFQQEREDTKRAVETNLATISRGRFNTIEEGETQLRSLKAIPSARRTQQQRDELEGLTEILAPLGTKGFLSDAILTGMLNSPFTAILSGTKKILETSSNFIFKAWAKAFPDGLIKGLFGYLKMAMKFMFTIMIYMTALFMLMFFFRKPIQNVLTKLSEFIKNDWPNFRRAFSGSLTLLKESFMDIYNGFKDGDLIQVLMGVWGIAWSLLEIAFTTLKLGIEVLLTIGKAFVANIFDRIIAWGTSILTGDLQNAVKKIALGVAVLAAIFIGWPFVIATAIIGGVVALIKFFKKRFFADGGTTPTGMSIVGERGPEILSLPAGSRVHSNKASAKMMGGSVVNNFNITINAKDTSKAEMRRIADEIGRQINQKINRKTGANIV